MSSTGPALTVLMTVRNGEPYLRRAVSSVLGQSYPDFQFLILDNASTDTSREIIRSFGDPRVRLIELPSNIGQTPALNRGLQMAETEYVGRMDADDVSLPGRLERQMSFLSDHPGVVLLGTWAQLIGEDGTPNGSFRPPTDRTAILDCFATHDPFAHCSVVFHTAAVKQIGYYPSDYLTAQDFALWFRLARRYDVANLPEELVQVRVHRGQASLSKEMKRAKRWDELRVYRQVASYDGLSPMARKAARRAAARSTVRYAEALFDAGRPADAIRWLGTAGVRYPDLALQKGCRIVFRLGRPR